MYAKAAVSRILAQVGFPCPQMILTVVRELDVQRTDLARPSAFDAAALTDKLK